MLAYKNTTIVKINMI